MLKRPDDIRYDEPNDTGHREAQFRTGWKAALSGQHYTDETLSKLTWNNLGWRLAYVFGPTSDEMIGLLYDWCVRQQAAKR
jgi:hypothetical protein